MTRGVLRFRIGRTPVAVVPFFWVTAVLLGFSTRDWLLFIIWIPVLFLAILLHELGHAVAFRVFGSPAAIELHGLGGHTTGKVDRASQDLMVNLAGSLTGFAVAVPLRIFVQPLVPFSHGGDINIAGAALYYFTWISIWWGVFNLLPILPLDGGQALDALLVMVRGHEMTRTVQIVSIVTAGLVLAWALWSFIMWLVLLVGLMLWANITAYRQFRRTAGSLGAAVGELFGNVTTFAGGTGAARTEANEDVVSLDAERRRRRRSRGVKDEVADALAALERHDHAAAMAAIEAARRHRPGGRTEVLLNELEAWAQLARRSSPDARRLLDALPRRHGSRPFLLAGIAVLEEPRGRAATKMADALLGGADDHSKLLAVELSASEGITEEVARDLLGRGSGGFEETLRFQQTLERLGRSGHAAIVDDVILGGA